MFPILHSSHDGLRKQQNQSLNEQNQHRASNQGRLENTRTETERLTVKPSENVCFSANSCFLSTIWAFKHIKQTFTAFQMETKQRKMFTETFSINILHMRPEGKMKC
ncbi:hypothetical protein FQA47_018246 [Oryzias melastigma]|uniref:Uncharacterized protein n=1 Tax=Oryzias melastigma TaxID=30732 RepID=A0A834FSY6_ORYME|nr:hypothetical protein FQA47_018246 [Oryzias melastigma]